jgi:hypothetical protein
MTSPEFWFLSRELPRGVWWRRVLAMTRLWDNGVHYPFDHPED